MNKDKKELRWTHKQTETYAPIIQHLSRQCDGLRKVERNLFETKTGDLYYVKLCGNPLPSFFGLSERILREYGSVSLHLIFYHAVEGFYIDVPYEFLSARLNQFSRQYSPPNQQFKVHFGERDRKLVLKELDLPVKQYYLSESNSGEVARIAGGHAALPIVCEHA